MTRDPATEESEVRRVLDELWNEKLLPFTLSVGKLTKESDEYIIHFHDSRISTARVPLIEGLSFRDMVRAAVLCRVAKMSGPLSWPEKLGDAHIFNTDDEEIWNYVNGFASFRPFINRVKARMRGIFSFPINLHTINQFFDKSFGLIAARRFIEGLCVSSPTEPRNFEEKALAHVGEEL